MAVSFREFLRNLQPDRMRVGRVYRHYTGRHLDLDDPKGLHEKINWLKLYGMTPLNSFCADKITASAYIASRIGPGNVVKRIFATYDSEDLRPELIGRRACMVKTNHDSGGVFPIPDTTTADWADIRRSISHRMRLKFHRSLREKQYTRIRPGIVVEEFLEPDLGSSVSDLRIYCFNGVPRFIRMTRVDMSSPGRPKILGVALDLDWNPLPFAYKDDVAGDVPRPTDLDVLIEQARQLSEPFELVRVDFLDAGDRFVVGELTFSPGGGAKVFMPYEAELALGAQLDHRAAERDWRRYLDAAQKDLDQCMIRGAAVSGIAAGS